MGLSSKAISGNRYGGASPSHVVGFLLSMQEPAARVLNNTLMKIAATILLFGLMLAPFGAEAQTKPATNLEQANQMIVLLQKQLLVLQQQLSEMKESNKKSSKTVYYASLSTEWNAKEAKSCYAISIAEDDGTAAIDEKISLVVVDKNTAVASLRKGKTFTLKTDDFGKAIYCGNATKITVKKGDLLKQDKSFTTTDVPAAKAPAQATSGLNLKLPTFSGICEVYDTDTRKTKKNC